MIIIKYNINIKNLHFFSIPPNVDFAFYLLKKLIINYEIYHFTYTLETLTFDIYSSLSTLLEPLLKKVNSKVKEINYHIRKNIIIIKYK